MVLHKSENVRTSELLIHCCVQKVTEI